MEAHYGVVDTHQGAVLAQIGAVEAHPVAAWEAHPGAAGKAHPGTGEAHPEDMEIPSGAVETVLTPTERD